MLAGGQNGAGEIGAGDQESKFGWSKRVAVAKIKTTRARSFFRKQATKNRVPTPRDGLLFNCSDFTCSRRSRRLRHDRSISAWLRLPGGSTKPRLRFDRGKYCRRQRPLPSSRLAAAPAALCGDARAKIVSGPRWKWTVWALNAGAISVRRA